MTSLSQVVDQMQANGLAQLPHGHPVLDGKIHRFGPKKKSWYALRELDLQSGAAVISGAFGVWMGANNNAVPVKMDWQGVSAEEKAAAELKQREYELRDREKKQRLAMFAAGRARMQWEAAGERDPAESDYIKRKQIRPEGVRLDDAGTLLVPMKHYSLAGAELVGLQKIAADGSKLFNRGMDKAGAALLLGAIQQDTPVLIIAEGYATAMSIRMATGGDCPVMVGFDAGNLDPVARAVRRDFPQVHILFAADDDWQLVQRFDDRLREDFGVADAPAIDGVAHQCVTEAGAVTVTATWLADRCRVRYIEANIVAGRQNRTLRFENTGIAKASGLVLSLGNASIVYPLFADRGEEKWTDFNDLHVNESMDAVAQQVQSALLAAAVPAPPSKPTLSLVQSPPPSAKKTDDPAGADATSGGEGKGRKPKEPKSDSFWDTVDMLVREFVLIYGDDTAWDSRNRIIIRVAHMRLAYGSDAVKFWLNNPDRRMVLKEQVVFDPTMRCDPDSSVNLFNGFKMQPKEGGCDKIMELLQFLCNGDAEILAWVLRWLAYPLQNPGAKMRTSIIIHGDEGSGKNLFFENVMRPIYGEYGGVIGNAQIESAFNEWASKKLYLVADEVVTRNELRQLKGKLKAMVTGEQIMINPKGMTERAESNHMNFVFLSNELQPLALDKTDRRYLVLWTPPKKEEAWYKGVAHQINHGGIEAFYHYLVHKVPCDGFNEHTKPIENDAKRKLVSLGLSPPERFYREWSAGFLPLPFVCCSAMQLYAGFCRWCHLNGERFPVTQTMFGRQMDRSAQGGVRRAAVKYELGEEVKQRVVYTVGEKPDDKATIAQWVEDASQLFETALRKYRHVYDQPSED